MARQESIARHRSALSWRTYSVRKADKEPLLLFITDALRMRGCHIRYISDSRRAPFYIVFETAGGDRHGVLAYAFFANAKVVKGRPPDEHLFQIKYGSDLKGVLDVAVDPHALITTIFLGIDPARGIFIAADPLMNNPSPMSRSVEFKKAHVDDILDQGWFAWTRDRRQAKTKTRAAFKLSEDVRTEVLVGGRQDILSVIGTGSTRRIFRESQTLFSDLAKLRFSFTDVFGINIQIQRAR